ncbi:GGDEF domain-containing protein [Luteimonas sp. FCS-9]|uniref:GGDEF domain-containing protein n=1 Tax=Luteimonas sp. FCS-9 TaxID=1547516 RepID=UPI00063E7CAB|nr:GGDEF domain-containing protein [Luteimonas sp. FCS-9]KLI98719.1 diguanylate cyclase [Luteimonas sp. FCS-9]
MNESTDLAGDDDPSTRLSTSWRECLAATPPAATALVADLVRHAGAFADRFYAVLLEDPRAAHFLSRDQVRTRLHASLQRWLGDLLRAGPATIDALIAANRQVGVVHARIGMPVDLVSRGTRLLRDGMVARIAEAGAAPETAFAAIRAVNASIDLALESMTLAYADAHDRSARTDAAYRLFSLAQNVGTERERQRALLLDWENALLYALAGARGALRPRRLSESEFGLWFLHKGIPIVGDNSETRHILALIAQIDAMLAPAGASEARLEPAAFEAIRARLASIRDLLGQLFGRVGALEAGSDALTNLLNRRFLPTVLRHEIELAASHGHAFSVVLLDIDHFKQINDRHGHGAGDRALQHVAALLTQSVRSSDYVFRLGGEEFLVTLVAADGHRARDIAETLRRRIADSPVELDGGHRLSLTASLGVAAHDGHPDYERLLGRADKAMYAAKRNGRNRVELAAADAPAT